MGYSSISNEEMTTKCCQIVAKIGPEAKEKSPKSLLYSI